MKNRTELTVPSVEGQPDVETQPAPADNCSWRTEEVPPTKAEILDEMGWTIPSLTSHFESLGFDADLAARVAIVRMEEARNWGLRLEKDFHFEKFPGYDDEDCQLLFYRGRNILVSAVDAARAATCGSGSESKIELSAAEIIGTLDARDVVEVPGPEIPTNLEGAVEGTYIPLELLITILDQSKLEYYASQFAILLTEFADKEEHLRELRLREKRHRKRRMEEVLSKGYQLCRTKVREERSRKAKLRSAKLRSEKRKP